MFDFSGDIEIFGDDTPRIAIILFRVFYCSCSSERHNIDSWWDQTVNLSKDKKFSPEVFTPNIILSSLILLFVTTEAE